MLEKNTNILDTPEKNNNYGNIMRKNNTSSIINNKINKSDNTKIYSLKDSEKKSYIEKGDNFLKICENENPLILKTEISQKNFSTKNSVLENILQNNFKSSANKVYKRSNLYNKESTLSNTKNLITENFTENNLPYNSNTTKNSNILKNNNFKSKFNQTERLTEKKETENTNKNKKIVNNYNKQNILSKNVKPNRHSYTSNCDTLKDILKNINLLENVENKFIPAENLEFYKNKQKNKENILLNEKNSSKKFNTIVKSFTAVGKIHKVEKNFGNFNNIPKKESQIFKFNSLTASKIKNSVSYLNTNNFGYKTFFNKKLTMKNPSNNSLSVDFTNITNNLSFSNKILETNENYNDYLNDDNDINLKPEIKNRNNICDNDIVENSKEKKILKKKSNENNEILFIDNFNNEMYYPQNTIGSSSNEIKIEVLEEFINIEESKKIIQKNEGNTNEISNIENINIEKENIFKNKIENLSDYNSIKDKIKKESPDNFENNQNIENKKINNIDNKIKNLKNEINDKLKEMNILNNNNFLIDKELNNINSFDDDYNYFKTSRNSLKNSEKKKNIILNKNIKTLEDKFESFKKKFKTKDIYFQNKSSNYLDKNSYLSKIPYKNSKKIVDYRNLLNSPLIQNEINSLSPEENTSISNKITDSKIELLKTENNLKNKPSIKNNNSGNFFFKKEILPNKKEYINSNNIGNFLSDINELSKIRNQTKNNINKNSIKQLNTEISNIEVDFLNTEINYNNNDYFEDEVDLDLEISRNFNEKLIKNNLSNDEVKKYSKIEIDDSSN